jgi:hypothetical protein
VPSLEVARQAGSVLVESVQLQPRLLLAKASVPRLSETPSRMA